MKFSEFKNRIHEGEDQRICLFEGEDAYFGESGLRLLRDKFVFDLDFDFNDLGTAQSDLSGLKDSLAVFPLLSPKRITCIREFYPKAEQLKGDLREFFEKPPQNCLLVIINTKECEQIKKFSEVTVIDCKKEDRINVARWIKGYLKELEVEIELETALLFADFCLCEMTRIKKECDKLACYAGKGGRIEKSDLELMISAESEYKIYDLTDCIAKKQFDKAIKIIKEMLDKGEPHQKILVGIYNYFRRLLHVSLSDKSALETGNLLKIKEYAVKKTIQQAKMFSPKSLKSAVDMLSNADYYIKSGTKNAEEQMWITVFSIMTQ